MEDVSKINQSEPLHLDKPDLASYGGKKHKKKKHDQKAKEHFDELTKIVEETHKELEANDSPFRICVYQEGEDIFIDIVTIDDSGKTDQIFKHDISHSEFENLIHQIKSGRGIILDADV